jgi:xylan 1,4-beta-xylosidase
MNTRRILGTALLAAVLAFGSTSDPRPQPPAAPGAIEVLLPGDFPDPTIIRAGDSYYMTHSSHDFVPGLLIWRSRDLLTWERVGYALNKLVGDVWAPDFARYGDRYYIYFPAGDTNWVVTAASPEGPWSEPVDLKISGIDPGHIATPDGKRYLYQDSGYVVPLSPDGLSVAGERRRVYEGWRYPDDWVVECFCLESPKLLYDGRFYFLTSAEGGTAGPGTSHMAVVARSKNVLGPWENDPANPLVHTWCKTERYLSKGHGTIFQDARGQWFVVYHAYENGYLPAGRQTLLERLSRTRDGWFRTVRDPEVEGEIRVHHNIIVEPDDFSEGRLKLQWQFSGLEDPEAEVAFEDGELVLPCVADGRRVMHTVPGDRDFEATVRLAPDPGVEAGLVLYYDDKYLAGIGFKDGYIFSLSKGDLTSAAMIEAKDARYLKVRLFEYDLSLFYSDDGREWKMFPDSQEVSGYQTDILGGFRSLRVGLYGQGEGCLRIDDFTYRALPPTCK